MYFVILLMLLWQFIPYIAPAPQIIKQPTDTTAAKPFGAHFTCTANGYGKIRILWNTKTHNGTMPAKATITEERSLESVTSTLFIPDVVVADEGGYYCTAWISLVSTSSVTAYLQEIGMKINMYNSMINIHNFMLHCMCILCMYC